MAGILDGVDQRTKLAGHNRLELLMFRLGGRQRFGINVFKVREVVQCPALTRIPNASPLVKGVANMRGKTIPVIDLAMAIGKRPLEDIANSFVIVTEYNRAVQGFLVSGVDRIVNINWESVLPPPKGADQGTYLTAVTQVDNELVEIVDVERVLSQIIRMPTEVSSELLTGGVSPEVKHHILVVDDSAVARNQIKRTLEQLGVECTMCRDGREALVTLNEWAAEGPIEDRISMVISDIEMPEMDGYTLTAEIRKNPQLKDLHVLLHTSLSGVFNNAMVEKVGANRFIAKFHPDDLAKAVLEYLNIEQPEGQVG